MMLVASQGYAKGNNSATTTITLPGGFTVSTESAIVGALAIVALIVVGLAYILRGKLGDSVTTIIQNSPNATAHDIHVKNTHTHTL